MIGDQSAEDEAKFQKKRALQSEIKRMQFAVDSFAEQAEYADRMAELHEKRVKQLRKELEEVDIE